jgi:hypothetical protein
MKPARTLASTAAITVAALATLVTTAADAKVEDQLRASWLGRWVVLRGPVQSNCDQRFTNNRMRGVQPSSGGAHRLAPGELGRVENLHVQRARVDLLIGLAEPLRVEFRDGPFQLYEQLECRVELQIPAPREAIKQGSSEQLVTLLRGVVDGPWDHVVAEASPEWNRRRVEPLPDDHEERLAAYHQWKEEQLYRALRGRLAEALDRAAHIAGRTDRSGPYAEGLLAGMDETNPDRLFSADCPELPEARARTRRSSPPEELDDSDTRRWKDGFEDGQRLLFEISLARRIERCLP